VDTDPRGASLGAEERRAPGRRAAFFDMDRTIVAGNTASIYIRDMHLRGAIRFHEIVVLWAIQARYRLALIDMASVMRRVVGTLKDSPEARLAAHCQSLFDTRIEQLISPAAEAAIREHRARGDEIVLLTAQTRYFARPLARRLRIDHVLCTELETCDGRFTGRVRGEVCYGAGKALIAAAWARARSIDLGGSYFYTDSFTDLPMLEAVGHPRVINPDVRLAFHARRRRWPILRFDAPDEAHSGRCLHPVTRCNVDHPTVPPPYRRPTPPLRPPEVVVSAARAYLVASMLALVSVPLVIRLAVHGEMSATWGRFPPPQSAGVPGFSWLVSLAGVALALGIIAWFVAPRWFGFRPAPASPSRAPRVGFPAWFWPGVLLCLGSWAVAWGLVPAGPLTRFAFVPQWWGFILALDGAVYRRNGGVSLLSRNLGGVLAIAGVSCVSWYFFEYLNYFVGSNWYYPHDALFSRAGYVLWFGLAYTTVLPSIFVFYTLLTTFAPLRARFAAGPTLALSRRGWQWVLALGLISLASLVVWPAPLFPMLWLSPLMVVAATLMLTRRWTPFTPLERGDWTPLALIALACALNYFVGELWNYYSTADNPNFWKYDVPYVGDPKLFEMPVLGFFGYLPFGMLCWTWWLHHAALLGLDPSIDVVRGLGPTTLAP
jgi:HAD superfamily hydrolase (TIGR01490 family)